MMTLLEIIFDAERQVDTYKHPDLDILREAVDPVLTALGECTVGGDCVESIYVDDDHVHIMTSYSCRGCSNTNDMTIPMAIVEAENPVRAATELTLRKKLKRAVEELNYARAQLPKLEEASQAIALELATFLKEQP